MDIQAVERGGEVGVRLSRKEDVTRTAALLPLVTKGDATGADPADAHRVQWRVPAAAQPHRGVQLGQVLGGAIEIRRLEHSPHT